MSYEDTHRLNEKERTMAQEKTVLIVDDEADMREIVLEALKDQYRCLTANSGDRCLEIVKQTRPDLIVMDVMMNGLLDGLDTAKKLKDAPDTKAIPIIMLTGMNQSLDYQSQMADDFARDKWLDKPVNPKVLLEEVDKLLSLEV